MNAEDISRISIIGAGLMGHGIALQFALAGYEVVLNDVSKENLHSAIDNVESSLRLLQNVGLVEEESAAASALTRVLTRTSLEKAVADADFVIEAVFEDLALKQRVFAELDRHAPEHTILASNTSSFMSSQLAPSTNRPDRVVVANWWNPPYLLPLVEIVPGPQTSNQTTDTTRKLFQKLGKRPVVLQKESLGFIGNRMQFALLREALSIVEHGIASAEDVDTVVKSGFGRRLSVAGPFEVFDMAGWDTILAIIEQLFPEVESSQEPPELVKNMTARGELGVKSGKGFYPWDDQSVTALRERVAKALAAIEQLSRESQKHCGPSPTIHPR